MSDNDEELIADLRHHSWEHTGEPTAALLWRAATALESATPRIVRTEWGVRDLTGAITPYYMERSARYFAERGEGELLSREVTEWQPFTPTESGEPQ